MRKGIFCLLLFIMLMLAGCGLADNNTIIPDNTLTLTPTESLMDTPTVSPTEGGVSDNTIEDNITSVPIYNVDTNREIYVYTVNYETLEKEAVLAVVPVDEELTPERLLSIVTDAMGDESFLIIINQVETQDDTVIVSFPNEGEPVRGLSEQAEDAILDAIAQSLLDNFDEYHKVIFRCDMKAYESDNHSFSIDYIYMED